MLFGMFPTEILPALEVQVVIDGHNDCYVTTGSSGYVEFGMKPLLV